MDGTLKELAPSYYEEACSHGHYDMANLIGAAPELLEACEALHEELYQLGKQGKPCIPSIKVFGDIVKSITKARKGEDEKEIKT